MKKIAGIVTGVAALAVVAVSVAVLATGVANGWFGEDGSEVAEEESGGCSGNCESGNCNSSDGSSSERDLCEGGYAWLMSDGYEGLVELGRTFIVLVHRDGCRMAGSLADFVHDYAEANEVWAYQMKLDEVAKTALYQEVGEHAAVVVVAQGSVAGYLLADSEDGEADGGSSADGGGSDDVSMVDGERSGEGGAGEAAEDYGVFEGWMRERLR